MKIAYTEKQTPEIVVTYLIPILATHRIITFTGPLGAGKTTLIKELLKQCGITKTVTSPTFGYFNTYIDQQQRTFYHFDLYRLKTVDDFIHAGFDEYLNNTNTWVLIEWPEIIEKFLQNKQIQSSVCAITMKYEPNDINKRILDIQKNK